nr:atrial natriuretic peptide receptor 3 [Vanessa tameamea]
MGWCVLFILVGAAAVGNCQNCRGEEPRERACENVCDFNGNCKIRAALLLPKNTTYDANLQVVEPVLELALQHDSVRDAFPSWLSFEWMTYDVTDCDAAYAVITAIDAYNDCAHVFFGPSCDYALASVARITKFLGNTGTPLVTTGGFTFDFVNPKQTCHDEYYMMVRAGPLGFKDLAYFLIDVMRQFQWTRAIILYDTPSYVNHVGSRGGFLLASTIHQYMTIEGIDVFGREIQNMQSHEDLLIQNVGVNYATIFSRKNML